MSTYRLEIITPERVVFDADVLSSQFPGVLGSFGVWANHAPMIIQLRAGAISVVHENGDPEFVATSEGFARVTGDRVTVLAQTAERAEEIDIDRVQAAVERARARLAEAGAEGYAEARRALQRAMARLEAARKQAGLEKKNRPRDASTG